MGGIHEGHSMIPDNSKKKLEQLRQEAALRAQLQQQYDKEMAARYTRDMPSFTEWLDKRPKPMAKGGKVFKQETRDRNLKKFLDESKEKRRLYHGTQKDFKEFKGGYHGVFLTPDPELSEDFSLPFNKDKTGGNTIPVHVQVKDPFDYENAEHRARLRKAAQEVHGSDKMHKYIEELNDRWNKNNWEHIESASMMDPIKHAGFDSYYVSESARKNLAVFDPRKIKSAIGNRGTYDTNVNDINKAKGGIIHKAKGGKVDALMEELRRSVGNEPLDPIGTAKRNLQGAYDIAKQVPSNLKRLATDPVGYAKSLPTPSGEQIMNMLQPSTVGAMAGVIKPVGGNWLKSSVEDSLKPLKRNTPSGSDPAEMLRVMRDRYTPEEIAKLQEGSRNHVLNSMGMLENDVALNKWVEGNLANYVKKQMGTAEDPVRKLAEEGVIHIPSNEVGINRWKAPEHRFNNKTEQLGQSPAAKAWEDSADMAINPMQLKDVPPSYRELWMDKASPDTQISHLSGVFDNNSLGFDHIMDTLRQDVAAGRIRPDQLNKVSMEQAVRRTHELDQEMARRMREAAIKQTEGFPVHKEYPEGYKWIELTTPKPDINKPLPEGFRWLEPKNGYQRLEGPSADDPNRIRTYLGDTKEQALDVAYQRSALGANSQKMLEDALKYEGNTMGHCVGGYCPDVLEGRSRIYSLRDAKGEPHVTVEVQPNQYAPRWDDVKPYLDAAREEAVKLPNGYTSTDIADIAIRMAKENAPQHIIQIKGKQNAAPKADYLPFVQDFVKSGKWGQVGDLKNTGLRHSDDAIGAEAMQALKEQGVEVPRYVTQEEAIKLSSDAMTNAGKYLPPTEGMKRGGKVRIASGITSHDEMQLALIKRRGKTKS